MTVMQQTKLAIDGGIPVRTTPLPPWPHFAADEIEAATSVLASGRVNYWTGEEGRLFEREFAAHCGTRHAIALANGTVALELALYAAGIQPGDEVITTSRTFIASASCVVMRGAVPVIADVDRISQNITAESIRSRISPRTRAIIAVHLAGWPCDMDPILDLARQHGLKVIEDCAQATGAAYHGRRVGSLGDVAAFSFCQDKIITTGGEGGMLTTDDDELWRKAWEFKDHGKSWSAVNAANHGSGFRWLHDSFGTNWRLTEMQSAIGRKQLAKLTDWITIRRDHAGILVDELRDVAALRVAKPPANVYHAYYKFYAFVRPERLKSDWNRDRIMDAITREGIPCFSGSCSEIYLEKAFTSAGLFDGRRMTTARELGETALMFLVHPTLTTADAHDTAAAIRKVFAAATR